MRMMTDIEDYPASQHPTVSTFRPKMKEISTIKKEAELSQYYVG